MCSTSSRCRVTCSAKRWHRNLRMSATVPCRRSHEGTGTLSAHGQTLLAQGSVKLAFVERAGTRDRDLNLESGGDCDCIPNEERATS